MDFDEYQEAATTTAVYPGQGTHIGLTYAALGLNGEAGETAEQVKKMWRDDILDIEEECLAAIDVLRRGLASTKGSYDSHCEKARERIREAFRPEITEERRQKLIKELGDNQWYAAQLATELGVSLGDVAQQNIDKLAARREANQIHGEGSER